MAKSPLLLALLLPLATLAQAGPEEEARAVVERWGHAFTQADVDGIAGLYAPDALFLGTGSKEVVSDPAAIRAYFERALLNDRPRTARLLSQQILPLSPDAVVITGLDLVTGVRDGTPTRSEGRVTFVVARRPDGWKIVHFHRSLRP